LHIKPRIETLDFWAGVPVLTFKIVVLWLVLDAFQSWWKRRRR
jgi:hypothetical protein